MLPHAGLNEPVAREAINEAKQVGRFEFVRLSLTRRDCAWVCLGGHLPHKHCA